MSQGKLVLLQPFSTWLRWRVCRGFFSTAVFNHVIYLPLMRENADTSSHTEGVHASIVTRCTHTHVRVAGRLHVIQKNFMVKAWLFSYMHVHVLISVSIENLTTKYDNCTGITRCGQACTFCVQCISYWNIRVHWNNITSLFTLQSFSENLHKKIQVSLFENLYHRILR